MKELNALNDIYQNMYAEDENKGYVVTRADKKGNTPAWQGYKAGKKKKDGKPMYRAADHLKNEELEVEVDEGYGKIKTPEKVVGKVRQPKNVAAPKGSKMKEEYSDEISPEVEKLIESGLFSDAEIAKIADIQEADIADIIARLEKKRISKGGNPDDSPLPAMKKYHADKKKKKVKEEVGSIEEADSLSGQVARWEAARQKRMKQRQSYERPSWIPRDQDHEDNWGSSKGEKKKVKEEKEKGLDGKACWDGYKLAGTKKKGGKTVDNCVKVKKESLSDWRDDLSSLIEIVAEPEEKAEKKVKEGKVNNKVVINPKISEAIQEMGGEVLEHHQVDCDDDCEPNCEHDVAEGQVKKEIKALSTAARTMRVGMLPRQIKLKKEKVRRTVVVDKILA